MYTYLQGELSRKSRRIKLLFVLPTGTLSEKNVNRYTYYSPRYDAGKTFFTQRHFGMPLHFDEYSCKKSRCNTVLCIFLEDDTSFIKRHIFCMPLDFNDFFFATGNKSLKTQAKPNS